jgi:hypothetical protein
LNNFPRERFPDSSGGFSLFLEIFQDFLFSKKKKCEKKHEEKKEIGQSGNE